MIKKIMLASCLLVASMASHAALISYNGYERDTAKNYVTGGGLEWLKWDVTKGISINVALANNSVNGWRLASNFEMAKLFNDFELGKKDWISNESASQTQSLGWTATEFESPHDTFFKLFGTTQMSSCGSDKVSIDCYADNDMFIQVIALYGSDVNADSKFNAAFVGDDSTFIGRGIERETRNDHFASLDKDYYFADQPYGGAGVALVRAISPGPVVVNAPGSIGLLALGLLALGFRRRQVIRR